MSALGVGIRVALGFSMPRRSRCLLAKQAVRARRTLNADIALIFSCNRAADTEGMMKIRMVWVGLLVLAAASGGAFAGKIYKCTDAEGNVTFSNAACPEDTQVREKTRVQMRSPAPSAPSVVDELPENSLATELKNHPILNPYSIENQLKHYKEEKLNNSSARAELKKRRANCEYYRAKVNEYSEKLRQRYISEKERLSDESHYRLLKTNVADFCP
jgi:hypothetical protein